MNKKELKERLDSFNANTSLGQLQEYVKQMIEVRGFQETETPKNLMLLLTEEMGELAKEIRKTEHLKLDTSKENTMDIEGEIADVFIYLLSMCISLNIDMFAAFKKKEEKNSNREWK